MGEGLLYNETLYIYIRYTLYICITKMKLKFKYI